MLAPEAIVELTEGSSPLIVSIPHSGTELPDGIDARVRDRWTALKDCDWHVERLYDFAPSLGATMLRTRVSRTVIDVNRDPDGASLYPGLMTTGLCPLTTFDGEPLYRDGEEPDAGEIHRRTERWFRPYHHALQGAVDRAVQRFGIAVVYEAHSIRSIAPALFDGLLPAINIGTADGASCSPRLSSAMADAVAASEFSHVVDGRFKGGWITRSFGRPARNVHAVQVELACRTYLDEPDSFTPDTWPPPWDPARAAALRPVLGAMLQACLDFAKDPK